MNAGRRYALQVVGCKVNQSEAEQFGRLLAASGWRPAAPQEDCDIVLVHTCTVTQRADRDSRRAVAQAARRHPRARIAVSGCLAELEGESLAALPNVRWVVRRRDRARLPELLDGRPSAFADPGFFGPERADSLPFSRIRAVIKIQDGCDGTCTYCRVRLARGAPVSRPLEDVLDGVNGLVARGAREVVVTGVNLGRWQPGLPRLLRELSRLEGRFRVHLSSIEPHYLTSGLNEALVTAGPRLCPHLHLPVQSGDDGVLAAMGRPYTAAALRRSVAALRQARPDVVLTGDVIVGFPGESPEAFARTRGLVETLGLARLHVFPYSPRPDTAAARRPDRLPLAEITRRARSLRAWSAARYQAYLTAQVGRATTVLLETPLGRDLWSGTTECHERATIRTAGPAGCLAAGRVTGADPGRLQVEGAAA